MLFLSQKSVVPRRQFLSCRRMLAGNAGGLPRSANRLRPDLNQFPAPLAVTSSWGGGNRRAPALPCDRVGRVFSPLARAAADHAGRVFCGIARPAPLFIVVL
jgi:hypothetical protein